MTSGPPVCLVIGGSDSCSGAGIQADLHVFDRLGVRGCSAITALTAQNPREITRIEPAPLAQLDAELHAIFDSYDVAAVKTGMLVDAEHVAVVSAVVAERHQGRPLVVDPVMIASSGAELLDAGGRDALERSLIPLASLITPNLDEAAFWLGRGIEDAESDARQLSQRFGVPVLLKGGHAAGPVIRDILARPDGRTHIHEHPRREMNEEQAHGTGCRLASSIAARLALGLELVDALTQSV